MNWPSWFISTHSWYLAPFYTCVESQTLAGHVIAQYIYVVVKRNYVEDLTIFLVKHTHIVSQSIVFIVWSWYLTISCAHVPLKKEYNYGGLEYFKGISNTSQEPWPWNCKSPKISVQRLSRATSIIMSCGHTPSSVVWSHMSPGPQSNAISMFLFLFIF